jgi:hypothetical protein
MSEDQTNQAAEQTTQVLPPNARKIKFFYKTIDIKDDEGNVIAKDFKHPDVEGVLQVPTKEEIVTSLNSTDTEGNPTKVAAMLIDWVHELVERAAKAQVLGWREDQPPKSVFKFTDFDFSKLTLEAISNIPKGQRGAWAPGDDDLKAFNEVYADVMINKVSYDEKKVKVHTAHFAKGLMKMKTDKAALAKMVELLTAFASATSEEAMEEVADTYNWLREKAKRYMEYTPKNFAEGL